MDILFRAEISCPEECDAHQFAQRIAMPLYVLNQLLLVSGATDVLPRVVPPDMGKKTSWRCLIAKIVPLTQRQLEPFRFLVASICHNNPQVCISWNTKEMETVANASSGVLIDDM